MDLTQSHRKDPEGAREFAKGEFEKSWRSNGPQARSLRIYGGRRPNWDYRRALSESIRQGWDA